MTKKASWGSGFDIESLDSFDENSKTAQDRCGI